MLSRFFPGGSLRVVAARAPRNLRAKTARVLFIDEADTMDMIGEGSPVDLATKRTPHVFGSQDRFRLDAARRGNESTLSESTASNRFCPKG
jgi:phage terminase large subunit GpA-like protein